MRLVSAVKSEEIDSTASAPDMNGYSLKTSKEWVLVLLTNSCCLGCGNGKNRFVPTSLVKNVLLQTLKKS